MLSWFRKHSKSWAVKALYVVLAATFFGGFGILSNRYMRERPAEESKEAVATANGVEISSRDFYRNYARAKQSWYQKMSRQYGEVPAEMLDTGALKQDVLDEMVGRALLKQQAEKLGVKVSSSEVNTQISQIPYFRDQTGAFNQATYKNILSQLGVTAEQFEDEVREQLIVDRVTSLVVAPVQVSADEVKEYYDRTFQELNLDYFVIDAEKRYAKLEPTAKEIEEYFGSHTRDFDWPETRRVQYLKFHIPDFEKEAVVSEAELKEYYEKSKDRYLVKPESAHFRHILIKAAEGAGADEIKKAQDKIVAIEDALKGGIDFAEEAKKYSEDTTSAINGGDLGWTSRGQLVPEFEQAGYALSPGGVSEPVRSKYGFHLLKLEELKPAEYKPLSEVKDAVKKELVRNQAHILAKDKADLVLKDCLGKSMAEAAKKNHLELRTSEYFRKGENNLEGLPDSRDISELSFLMTQGEISEVLTGKDDLYIFEVTEIKDPHQATLEETHPKIVRKLEPEIRLAKAKEDGRKDLEELRKGPGIAAVARKENSELKETGFFPSGSQQVPGIGYSKEFSKMVFSLTLKDPAPKDVYDSAGRVYVLKLKALKPADPAQFDSEKETVKKTLLTQKRQEAFDRYLQDLKKGKVQIKEEVYKKIE